MTDQTSDPLDVLSALAEAATPGPWRHSGATVWRPMSPDDPTDYSGEAVAYIPTLGDEFDADDAAYIAAMSPDVSLALIARIRRAKAALTVERLAMAEHSWCVQVEGEFALRHKWQAHVPQAEFIVGRLAALDVPADVAPEET